jgi:hypothetical protein
MRRSTTIASVSGPSISDLHVHTEWSYDAPEGSMERTCRRAVDLGVPVVAFTEHADFDPPATEFDVDGYLESIERCRGRFSELRILTGVELGEPHRFPARAKALLGRHPFDLVLGSCHCIPVGDRLVDIGDEGTLEPQVARENVHAFFAEATPPTDRGVFSELRPLTSQNPAFFELRCPLAAQQLSTGASWVDQAAGDGSEAARDRDPGTLTPPCAAE